MGRMSGPHQPPEGLRALDLNRLVGLSVDEARAIVEDAGGQLRVTRRGEAVTADYRPARVTVLVDDRERVTRVFGLG
jgi:hypothetical protein